MKTEEKHIATSKPPRENWEKQFQIAIANGEMPENDVFDKMSNESDETEWTWPETNL